VAPNTSCSIAVVFKPTATGTRTGRVVISEGRIIRRRVAQKNSSCASSRLCFEETSRQPRQRVVSDQP
jgi:hypothetical protein